MILTLRPTSTLAQLHHRQYRTSEAPLKLSHHHAKKVVSNSLGLVDFAIGLVIFVLNLPDRQVLFFGEIQITEGL